ncbi:YcjX family protein [Thaumasiovibrio subtropicus]|uniref:YcjX family protein n=1 Tax=Thaumasiovibrio subtropicus TaxID=1891207 RepID=UPI000B34F73B|nr:YcjX family protein [Thaumasiovibrio subtropicus]
MRVSIGDEVNKWVSRGLDRHIRLAVTGLSTAGKTAFITSLVNQLLHVSTNPRLPLFAPVRDGVLQGAKRVPQPDLCMARFGYDEGMGRLLSDPPSWPQPTNDVSQIRLALKYVPQQGALKYLQNSATLYLDIIDYPGEWLLDLPMLELDFYAWSEQQFASLKGKRETLAATWRESMRDRDWSQAADESLLAEVSKHYTDYLYQCKSAAGLHWVQPGRFVLPGELAGAPVLQFFPIDPEQVSAQQVADADKDSALGLLKARFEHYKQHVIKPFYKQHFSKFDRQIILVDCLQPLNAGPESFNDMRQAIEHLMGSFRYGRNNLLKRLFAPRIDKVLFAATKADHVTPEQHPHMVSLMQQIIHEAYQHASFEGISMECMSLASISATTPGFVSHKGEQMAALQGTGLDGEARMLFPGEVPKRLPNSAFWDEQGFDFVPFRPGNIESDEPLPHIRMDKALQYLLGDKF